MSNQNRNYKTLSKFQFYHKHQKHNINLLQTYDWFRIFNKNFDPSCWISSESFISKVNSRNNPLTRSTKIEKNTRNDLQLIYQKSFGQPISHWNLFQKIKLQTPRRFRVIRTAFSLQSNFYKNLLRNIKEQKNKSNIWKSEKSISWLPL